MIFQKAPALRAPEPQLPLQNETLWEGQADAIVTAFLDVQKSLR